MTDAEGRQTSYTYDPSGRLLSRTVQGGYTESNEFSDDGRLSAKVDANGNRVEYTYDSLGRVDVEYWYTAGTQELVDTIEYEYDQFGRITMIQDSQGYVGYTYDDSGRITSVSSPQGVIHYVWDEERNILERMYTGDENSPTTDVYYDYNSLYQLSEVHQVVMAGQAVDQITSYVYDEYSRVDELIMPNGIVIDYSYDQLSNLTQIDYISNNDIFQSVDYTHDIESRRLQAVFTVDGQTRTVDYTYDALGRLVRETVNHGESYKDYQYDLSGNRAYEVISDGDSVSETYYVYDPSGRLSYTDSGESITANVYDASGHLIEKTVTENGQESKHVVYEYDVHGRMTAVDLDADGAFDVEYIYNPTGWLVGKVIDGDVYEYIVDPYSPSGYTQVIEEWKNDVIDAVFIYGLNIISSQRQNEVEYYLHDAQGSTTGLSDSAGNVTDRYIYDAFGVIQAHTGDSVNNVLYTGERFDKHLGQYELRARRYDPSTGQFTGSDPLKGDSILTLNPYAYAYGDPVNGSDPSGEITLTSILTTAGIVSTTIGIAMPAYQVGAQTKSLLDIADFVISIRKGLHVGWLDYTEFTGMHYTAQMMALHAAANLVGSLFELGLAIVESTSWGQAIGWVQVAGGAADMAWGIAHEDNGDVSGYIEEGEASFIKKAFAVHISAATREAGELIDGHHLIPKAALSNTKVLKETLSGARRWTLPKNVGHNILGLSRGSHQKLHALMRDAGLGPTGDMAAVFKRFKGRDGYVKALRSFYQKIDKMDEYTGILDMYDDAFKVLGDSIIMGS